MTTNPTARFRHRTPEVEAVQWTDTNAAALEAFAGHRFMTVDPEDRIDDPDATASLMESAHNCWSLLHPGDWVVKCGEDFGVVTAADFAERYAPAAPVSSAAALRDHVAEALYAHDHPSHVVPLAETGMEAAYRQSADAVLAVLPTGDRATALREAADRLAAKYSDDDPAVEDLRQWADAELCRLAAEAQPSPATVAPSARAGLRQQLVDALWEANGPSAAEELNVDAVLAVLYREWPWLRAEAEDVPAVGAGQPDTKTANRAAIYREAADELDSVSAQFDIDACDCGNCPLCAWKDAARHLRRLADGTQQPKGVCPQCGDAGACAGGPCPLQPPAGSADVPQVAPCPPGCIACATDESHDPAPAVSGRPAANANSEETRVVRCSRAILSRPHEPHGWYPQPGMDPVDCPGHSFTEEV